ncbi:uncharacterized protein B0H18DRAFT_1101093 [Fomitopsis serialis]|uniref:uncharacterized protein n=1 Tax=Fomitopsis serialis TaxID=139415 RepID=UPI002008C3BC|nr:uncharacterized protein B0H18DRAFT_1101093 [Neoantrodia serialis]KAH9936633.1 hypothetical protein B0H18DRAFT_1101093 [Neoantrodia serialis]
MEDKIAQVSLDTFLREFVPGPDLPPGATIEGFCTTEAISTESTVYGRLCEAANSVFNRVPAEAGGQRLVAEDTHRWVDLTDETDGTLRTSPGVIVYPVNEDAIKAYTIEAAMPNQRRPRKRQRCEATEARAAWFWVSLLLHAKVDPDDSPFAIPDSAQEASSQTTSTQGIATLVPPPPAVPTMVTASAGADLPPSFLRLKTTGGATRTVRQLTDCVAKVLQRQFLLWFFTVFVCRDHAWLLRWDRMGLVVSEPFNFVQQPHVLHNFLHRFACMSDLQRGRDLTVVPASEEEAKRMRCFTKFDSPSDWRKIPFATALAPGWPIYKISVPEDDMISAAQLKKDTKEPQDTSKPSSGRMRGFLVGKPSFTNTSVTGRATKCHIAYDISEDRLVFCKEYWRTDTPTSHPEGDVYLRLHSKNVSFIATPIAAGDVRNKYGTVHHTRAQEFTGESDRMLVQYRLILKEIAQPLKEYTNSLHLVQMVYSYLRAHEEAWLEAGVLHRDISGDNLMIYWYFENGQSKCKALLVDWGLCKYREEMDKPVVRKNRSGTWQFISAVLLVYPGTFAHEVWHDLESFIHVLHWMCLRFHITDASADIKNLINHVSAIYDHSHKNASGSSVGGYQKLRIMQNGDVPFRLIGGSAGLQTPGLHRLFLALAALYKEQYKWLEPQLHRLISIPAESQKDAPPQVQQSQVTMPSRRLPARVKGQLVVEVVPAQPVLNDHIRFAEALEQALFSESNPWTDDEKTIDQFAYDNSVMKQHMWMSREASRRSPEEEISVKDKARKRVRSGTHTVPWSTSSASQLGSKAGLDLET